MFFQDVIHCIDFISTQEFKDDKLEIRSSFDVIFFLFELSRFKNESPFTNLFVGIYEEVDLRSRVVGLCISKTDFTSVDGKVNPFFIKTLKKSSTAYFKALASNWKVSLNSTNYFRFDVGTKLVIENGFKGMYGSCTVIANLIKRHKFSDELTLYTIEHCDYILGERKFLELFSACLRQEAQASENSLLSLTTISCRAVCDNFKENQKKQYFQHLPIELKECINEELPFCIQKP
jgi:hypothetical protein